MGLFGRAARAVLLAGAVLGSGCGTRAPQPAPDNVTDPSFNPPARDSLIVLLPPVAPAGVDLAAGEEMLVTQIETQLRAAGYRVETLPGSEYDRLWSREVAAVGGIFDATSGAHRPQAQAEALSSLARHVCEDKGCALLVRQRMAVRSARLAGTYAEWDGMRRQVPTTDDPSRSYRYSGSTTALSVELTAIDARGGFAFRRFGGAALPFEINNRELKSELRRDLFASDAEVAAGARLALEPLTR